MNRHKFILISSLLIFGFASKSYSETMKLIDLKLHALENSPEISQLKLDYSSALAKAKDVALLNNPELAGSISFPYNYDANRGDNEIEVSLSQKLRLSDFGKRGLVSSILKEQATVDKKLQMLKGLNELSLTYYRLWALQAEQKHISAQQKRAQEVKNIVEELSAQGRVDHKDKEIVLAKVAEITASLVGINYSAKESLGSLVKKAGLSKASIKAVKPKLANLPPLQEIISSVKKGDTSVVGRIRLQRKLAHEQLKLAKQDTFPAFTPMLSYSHNDEGKDFVGVGVSLELPIFNRQQPSKLRANSAVSHSMTLMKYIENGGFDSELQTAYERVAAKRKQAKLYEDSVVPRYAKAVEIANEQLKAGQISMLELWQLEHDYHEAYDRALEFWIEAFAAQADLSLFLGEEL